MEHLYAKEKARNAIKQQKVDEATVNAANEEEFEVTFKPKTLNYPMAPTASTGDKCIDLYKRVKEGQYARNMGERGVDGDPDYAR